MSPEDQNIEIAKACGWKSFPYCIINGVRKDIETWLSKEELEIGFTCDNMPCGTFAGRGVPSYVNSLRDMHEAEKFLDEEKADSYMASISNKHDPKMFGVIHWSPHDWSLIHADAGKKAEAFLKAIGKWIESNEF